MPPIIIFTIGESAGMYRSKPDKAMKGAYPMILRHNDLQGKWK